MARRRPVAGLVKIHRNYTIADVAELFHIHRNTVRRWTREGLHLIKDRKPHLILGQYLAAFLAERKSKAVRLGHGEFYCVKCKEARRAALGMVDYVPITAVSGNLRGLCPECGILMHRRTALLNVTRNAGDLDVAIVEVAPRIADRHPLSTNGHFEEELQINDNPLPGK